MTVKPIHIKAPLIRALLDGRKTMDREIITSARTFAHPEMPPITLRGADLARALQNADGFRRVEGDGWTWSADAFAHQAPATRTTWFAHLGYAPGDLLWVREACKEVAAGEVKAGYGEVRYGIAYQADGFVQWNNRPTIIHDLTGQPASGPLQFKERPWRPSIHMRRHWSRLTLEVTAARVERLQDISEEDAKAEGVYYLAPTAEDEKWYRGWCEDEGREPEGPMSGVWMAPGTRKGWGLTKAARAEEQWGPTPQFAYRCMWQARHGEGSWDANPWVSVISFETHKQNVDALLAARAGAMEPSNG